MWPITLSGRLPIVDLVGRYLTNYLIGRELTLHRISPLTPPPCGAVVLCGIRTPFGILSPCEGQIAHALLTRPPLKHKSSSRSFPPYVSARLACVRHAASVRPEPGSNSSVQSFISSCSSVFRASAQPLRNLLSLLLRFGFCIVFKVHRCALASQLVYNTPPQLLCQALF